MRDIKTNCNRYGRCFMEIVNLLKDIIYCISVTHTNVYLQYMLWAFTLFAFFFNLLGIIFMNKNNYIKCYGNQECIEVPVTNMKTKKQKIDLRIPNFTCIKVKRVLKENFFFVNEEDLNNKKI